MPEHQRKASTPPEVKIQKREIPCPVCECGQFSVLYEDELGDAPARVDYSFEPETQKIYQIVKCARCQFVFANPIPVLDGVYTDNVDETYLNSVPQRRRTAQVNVRRIRQFAQGGRLLDIGCATGVFLDAAAEHFDVEGIELSEWAAENARGRHTVYGQTLEQLGFVERFDVVTLWGVVEHFSNPAKEIELVYKSLRPGGIIVLYTGDIDSWLARIMRRRWYWFMGMHLMYFSGRTLSMLLHRFGFEPVYQGLHTTYFELQSLAVSMRRFRILHPFIPILSKRPLRDIIVPLKLSGEMLMIARKPSGA